MRPLRPGQDTVLAWSSGAVECRVIAAAGQFALLYMERFGARANEAPHGPCSLTYLDGFTPMGWDGVAQVTPQPREIRFQMNLGETADRRASVRVPVAVAVDVTVGSGAVAGRSLDVSAGGMRLRHPGQLQVGTPVRVRAQLPEGPLVEADTVVRKSEDGLSSVEFLALHAGSAQDIGSWTVQSLRTALSAA